MKPTPTTEIAPQPIEVKKGELVLGHSAKIESHPPPSENPPSMRPAPPTQSLGDMYAAIDAAPAEWLPSLLARVVKRSLKSGAWSDVGNLILSVRGFSKLS